MKNAVKISKNLIQEAITSSITISDNVTAALDVLKFTIHEDKDSEETLYHIRKLMDLNLENIQTCIALYERCPSNQLFTNKRAKGAETDKGQS